jgi:predicted dehydrogenase
MADKLRAGIIGCGEMSLYHAFGYLNSARYEVAALADLSEQAMKDFDDKLSDYDDYKPKHFTDAREMLEQSKLDVVSVAVWDKGHAPFTIAAAANGAKAVLCEKPMAESIGVAADMLTVCRRHGTKLTIGHQRRFLPSWVLAKQMIADGEIGDVRLILCYARDGLPPYSTHQTDMFRFLLGDAECTWVMGNVERETDHWSRSIPIEDRAVGVFGFDNGAQAMILSDLTPEFSYGAHIYGSDGMIELTITDLKVMNGKTGGWQRHVPDGEFFNPADDRFEMLEAGAAQARGIADWVSGAVPDYRGEATHGYKALEMVHAVYESARTHTQVRMPLKTLVSPLELMIDSGKLPVRHPGPYDIRVKLLRGENVSADTENV